jgi:octaprenyl-diphosphate synthase
MKENLISELHDYLSDELEAVNCAIISSSHASEELVGIISSHLINSGGKRIRPIINILSARAFGGSSIELAAAVEFIHAATLLHDDVVDTSDVRRGKKTANFLWGNKASILVGDFLFSQAFKLMVASGSMKALELLSSASAIIAEGEVMQLRHLGNMLSQEEYYKIIAAKTAELFSASAASGASIAGASASEVSAMKVFGLNLGLIFQIRDDALDYFGDFSKMGKKLGQDFYESKCTLPVILAMRNGENDDKNFLIQSFADEIEKDFGQVVTLLQNLGVEQEIELQITKLQDEALKSLDSLKLFREDVELLREILYFAAERVG